jgi:hypothetical protein
VTMISQPDSAARVCEFAGEISIFPASQGRGVHAIRNAHAAETDSTLNIRVPVRRVHEARIGFRADDSL